MVQYAQMDATSCDELPFCFHQKSIRLPETAPRFEKKLFVAMDDLIFSFEKIGFNGKS